MKPFATMCVLAMAIFLGQAFAEPAPRDGGGSQSASHMERAESPPPLPKLRPKDNDAEAVGRPAAPAREAPLPRPRPEQVPGLTPPEEAEAPRLAPSEHSACMRELEKIGVSAEILPEVRDQRCGMRWPLRLEQIGDDGEMIDIEPAAKVRCTIAEALAAWMEAAVQPAAEKHLGARVTGLRIASSYVCRTRNHVPDARLSEHALGNAIDIAGFQIEGDRWVVVGPREDEGEPDAQFLAEVREAACDHFHTVLAPGSDAYHTDHFHLDLARRGASGTRRYCR